MLALSALSEPAVSVSVHGIEHARRRAKMSEMDTDELFDNHPEEYRRALGVLCEAHTNPSSTPYDVLVVLVPILTEISDHRRATSGPQT
jgi:hypothetical protein